ncbi:MAG: hypothetical protein IPP48_12580 [Chitinophagaceae bacterium]|nr:hypothetical protein [Chitinophagaceae bacterium]
MSNGLNRFAFFLKQAEDLMSNAEKQKMQLYGCIKTMPEQLFLCWKV